jgi:hypothetical protein
MQRPDFSAGVFASVTETLALWLARGWQSVSAEVQTWDETDWNAAAWVAYWQGGIPRWVERLDEASVGQDYILPYLREVAAFSHERTRRMLDATQELIMGLRALGIEAIPLKGARLAPFYYQPPSLRPFGDVDVLIRPGDVQDACAWMEAHGYTFYSRSVEDVVYLRGARLNEVWHPDNVHPIELHFRLREEFGGAGLTWDLSDDAWRESTKQSYLQTEALLVSPIFLLRHLCAHTTSDIFIRRGKLQQLEDIARVARTFAVTDWQMFARSIPKSRARFVHPALVLTARYYDEVIAAEVLRELYMNLTDKLRAWVDGLTLAAASESNLESRSGIGFSLAQLLTETPSEQARAMFVSLCPPRWNLMKRYPRLAASPFYPLCYVLLNLDRAWHIARKAWERGAITV